jgi:hypothetical protein
MPARNCFKRSPNSVSRGARAYSLGWQQLALSGAAAALPHFHRDIEVDGKFAMAYAALGRIYADLDQLSAAMENTKRRGS